MAKALTFPGQGSQAVGMGKTLAEQFPQARMVFDEVNDSLGQNLSKIMFEGPEAELTLTANAQPALMAVSIAVIKVMEAQGLVLKNSVRYVAGHSLGEYSALCAAGMFSLADTARLLRIRGKAMQKAVPVGQGAMAAIIGLDDKTVSALCSDASALGVCQIANDNGGGQLVISGNRQAVERAVATAGEKGAKRALMLPVSAPFHCVLMEPAAEEMRAALADVVKHNPVIPVIPNVSVAAEQDAQTITHLLVEQVTGRVRWRETVEWFAANGITDIYEIGSGRVLTGLARRIDKELRGMSVANLAEREEVKKLGATAEEQMDGVDILVNNAGITRDGLFVRLSDDDWDQVLSVNLSSVFYVTRAIGHAMMRRRFGRIINISSIVGFTGNAGQTNYCAAKAGLIGFSKALAQEFATRNVTVNCIAPGFVETAMTDKLSDKIKDTLMAQIPMKRMGSGADIAAAAVYLASDEASYMTGETLHVNGGMAMI